MEELVLKENNAPEVATSSRNRFPPPKPRNRNVLPANPNQSVRGLERKYRETLGELKTLQEAEYDWVGRDGFALAEKYYWDRLNALRATLVTIEKAIRMFDVEWGRKRHMAPKVIKNSQPLLPKGKLSKTLIHILRDEPQPLLVRELAERAAHVLKLPYQRRDQRQRVWSMTNSALHRFYDLGRVDVVGKPAKWFAISSMSGDSISIH